MRFQISDYANILNFHSVYMSLHCFSTAKASQFPFKDILRTGDCLVGDDPVISYCALPDLRKSKNCPFLNFCDITDTIIHNCPNCKYFLTLILVPHFSIHQSIKM